MKIIKLFLAALAAMVTMGVNAQTWTGNDVAEGSFYFYNIGAGKWLSTGNSWGTQASLVEAGGFCSTLEISDGKYAIKNTETRTNNKAAGPGYLGTNAYMDGESAAYFTFTEVTGRADGVKAYYIQNGTDNLAYSGTGTVVSFGTETGDNAQWVLVTKADRLAAMANATEANPVDATFLLKNPGFGRYQLPAYDAAWKFTFPGDTNKDNAGDNTNFCVESYHTAFDFAQTIADAPNGYYAVRGQAFYRQDGSNNTDLPYFYVGSAKINFPAKTGNEGSMTDASNSFKSGSYQTDWSDKATYAGGGLNVGTHLDKNTALWCIWDNIQIQYYGPIDVTAYAAELANAVTAAQAYKSQLPAAAYSPIATAITENNKTYTTEAEYTAAITAINNAVSTYASAAIIADYDRYNTVKAAAVAIASGLDTTEADNAVEAATTEAAIDAAIVTLRAAFLAKLSNVTIPTDPGYIDVTAVMVDNAGVHTNTDYWTIANLSSTGGSAGVCNYGECEFYKRNFKFYQTLVLSKGTWEFGVTGFHREGNHNTNFYAGGSKVLIPGVPGSGAEGMEGIEWVNNMAQAKTYFDNGNGKVSVKFALDAAGNVEIGIDNQDTETDKWTIFRDFTLKYFGEAVDLTAYKTQLAEAVAKAEAVNGTVPAAVYSSLADVVTANKKTYTTVADYETAISNIETATNNAKAIAVPYTEYKAVKAKVEAMKSHEGYTETTSGAANTLTSAVETADTEVEKATNTEGIDTQVAALKAAGKTFLGGVRSDGEHPFDITFLITNPSFDNNDAIGWTANPAPGFQTYTNCEYYQTEFDINQTLTDMPKGNYELKVQAFQRPGWFDAVYSAYQSGTNNVSSVIYINDGETTIKNLVSEGATTSDAQWANGNDSHSGEAYYANSMNGASKAFAKGNYWNTVLTAVEGGDLKFGFKSTKTHVEGDWTIFDNFQLFYYGNRIKVAMSETEAFSALADIEGADVRMTRSIKEGFNTIALPFDLDADQVVEVFGSGTKVYSYSDEGDADATTINFNSKDAATIEANVPVLVKATKTNTEIHVDNVTVQTGAAKVEGTNFDFVGNYGGSVTIPAGDWFIGSGALYESKGSTTIKGFRAYLKDKNPATDGEVKALTLNIDGVATGIATIENGELRIEEGAIYNIAGQRLNKLQKGINIVNGKKVVVK